VCFHRINRVEDCRLDVWKNRRGVFERFNRLFRAVDRDEVVRCAHPLVWADDRDWDRRSSKDSFGDAPQQDS